MRKSEKFFHGWAVRGGDLVRAEVPGPQMFPTFLKRRTNHFCWQLTFYDNFVTTGKISILHCSVFGNGDRGFIIGVEWVDRVAQVLSPFG